MSEKSGKPETQKISEETHKKLIAASNSIRRIK